MIIWAIRWASGQVAEDCMWGWDLSSYWFVFTANTQPLLLYWALSPIKPLYTQRKLLSSWEKQRIHTQECRADPFPLSRGKGKQWRLTAGEQGRRTRNKHCSVCVCVCVCVCVWVCLCVTKHCIRTAREKSVSPSVCLSGGVIMLRLMTLLASLLWLLVLGLLWERWIEGNSSLWVRGLGLQTRSSPVWDFAPMPDT